MAGTSSKSKVVTARVPLDLAAWMDARTESTNDLIVLALQDLRRASSVVPTGLKGEVAWFGLRPKGKAK